LFADLFPQYFADDLLCRLGKLKNKSGTEVEGR
jgi:hypothetical protein